VDSLDRYEVVPNPRSYTAEDVSPRIFLRLLEDVRVVVEL